MNLTDNCAICRVSMARYPVTKLIPCHHLLHTKCAEPVINIPDAICPLCRVVVTDNEPITRQRYGKYTDRDRQRIVTCANRGDDWVALAASLGVKYKTAFHWVRSGRDVMLAKGGKKPKIMTEDEIDLIISWIEEKCDYTMKQIKEKILQTFEKNVSVSTIGNYLEGRLFTVKQVHKEPLTMNSEEKKIIRAEYVRALNIFIQQGKQIVWMDETNFNLFCRRTRGRARAGVRAVQHLPASRGPNVHLIGAISAAGVVAMERRRGSFTSVLANAWVRRLLQQWEDMGNQLADLIIVCDNAPCHSTLETVINGTAASLLRLAPYSPMLNPIECIWSKVKCYVKTHLQGPHVEAPHVIEQRLVYLEAIIDEAKDTIVGGDCARAAQRTTAHHAAALAMNDMPVGR